MKRWTWLGLALLIVGGASQLCAQELPGATPAPRSPHSSSSGSSAAIPSAGQPSAPPSAASGMPQAAQAHSAPPAIDDFRHCLRPSELEDGDGDVRRNVTVLSGAHLCIKQHIFDEGDLRWVLHIIQSKQNPNDIFWFVPHDDEHDAFDSALYGIVKFGGTVVAIEANGHRFNGPQDPNRNFDTGTGNVCPGRATFSSIYTASVMRWRTAGAPIVALHTNGGAISISRPPRGSIPFKADAPIPAWSSDNTLIFVASTALPANDRNLMLFVKKLNERDIHVLYEVVSPEENDCSMSNYAALKGIRDYINIEVAHTDGVTQRHLIDAAVGLLREHGIGPAE